MKNLRDLIGHVINIGWIALDTGIGFTGYLDEFKENESNGYGYDGAGRAFIQINVKVEGKKEMIRVFERYEGEHGLLVCSGTGKAEQIFASSIESNEWKDFVGLVVNGKGFKQSEAYFDPMTVDPV